MKYFGVIMLVLITLCVISISFKTCGRATDMVNNGVETIYQQFKPSELLRKYEWFKDAAAQLDSKRANIKVYEDRFISLKNTYGADSLKRTKWARDDREQYNIWQSEYSGVVASYNDLAGEYNSQMAKFNYAFCNAGQMPESNMDPQPREFRLYLIK